MSAADTLARSLATAGFRGEMREEEPLSQHTTWQIGGPAELLASPADEDDLATAVAWASRRGVPWRVLGNGSNLLVADAGVRGLVLRVRKVLNDISVDGTLLRAGAGASFPAVANLAASRGLAGLEFATGIPGTVGGAVVMNAGWHEHETGNVVESVGYMEADGNRRTYAQPDCRFGYRKSIFRGRDGIVLAAVLRLTPGDPAELLAALESFAASRKENQPTSLPSCGSVYLKPEGDFAGRLIDTAGLKGTRVGGLEVSSLHANFFINRGQASCADALALMERVESEVLEKHGVRLQREVELWQ